MRVAVPRSSGSAGYGDVPAPQDRRPVDGLDVRAGYQRVLLARDAIQEIPAQGGRQDPPGLRRVVCRPGAGYRIQAVVGRRRARAGAAAVGHDVAGRGDVAGDGHGAGCRDAAHDGDGMFRADADHGAVLLDGLEELRCDAAGIPRLDLLRGDGIQDREVCVCMRRLRLQGRDAAVQVPAQGSRQDPAGLVFVIFRPGIIHEIQTLVGRRRRRVRFIVLLRIRSVGDDVAQGREVAVDDHRISRLHSDGQAGDLVEDGINPFQRRERRGQLVDERQFPAGERQVVVRLRQRCQEGAVVVRVCQLADRRCEDGGVDMVEDGGEGCLLPGIRVGLLQQEQQRLRQVRVGIVNQPRL